MEVARQVGRRRAHGDGVEGVDEVASTVLLRVVRGVGESVLEGVGVHRPFV